MDPVVKALAKEIAFIIPETGLNTGGLVAAAERILAGLKEQGYFVHLPIEDDGGDMELEQIRQKASEIYRATAVVDRNAATLDEFSKEVYCNVSDRAHDISETMRRNMCTWESIKISIIATENINPIAS